MLRKLETIGVGMGWRRCHSLTKSFAFLHFCIFALRCFAILASRVEGLIVGSGEGVAQSDSDTNQGRPLGAPLVDCPTG